ncbi:MAG: dGTP triphosphohydrolase [Rubrivivax sp.]
MNWRDLLQPRRIGRKTDRADTPDLAELRTEFFRDWDRIVFCSAFRRLQDKTQVHPMAKTDYVRTRLTHSLEVASVGRSLGMQAGRVVSALDPGLRHLAAPQDMGAIVAAACLMHDIGNPPFGHAGESAIQEYFRGPGHGWLQSLPPAEQADLLHFEGNAQGFRTAVRLQHPEQPGGLQLTWPTLGAFAKYPCDAVSGLQPDNGAARRKFGYMQGERGLFAEVAEGLGLQPTGTGAWQRHPLAFLVEAADDICYGVIDIEDGAKSGHITPQELRALHEPFIDAAHRARADTLQDRQHQAEYLRAVTIGALVDRVARVFRDRHDEMLAGRLDVPLLDHIEGAQDFRRFRQLAADRLYDERSKLELQVAGFEIIGWLLQALCEAVERMAAGAGASERARMLVGLIPAGPQALHTRSRYERLLMVTDFVAGMTDTYAVELYRRLRGFSA